MHVKPSALSILLRGDACEGEVAAQDLDEGGRDAEERFTVRQGSGNGLPLRREQLSGESPAAR